VIQIQRQIESLSKNSLVPVLSFPIIGSANINRQIENLKKKPQIIVGTPGRILELIQKKKIKAHTVQTVIIDEADRLMDINNIEGVQGIIKYLLKERQLIIVSATMPPTIVDIAKKIMRDPVLITSERKQRIPEHIYHIYLTTEQRDKIETLKKLINNINPEKAIVFINNVDQIDNLAGKLKYNRIKAESLHGTIQKKDRKKVMDDFRSGKIKVLIASDIAARGLQMEGIPIVFNMDIPEKSNEYLHRAGRTGRNNQEGLVISLAAAYEIQSLKKIEKDLKIKIEKKVYYNGQILDEYPDHKKRS
jgi:superfamily II DNA/RNA helicase